MVVVPVLGPLRRIRRRRVISACHAVTNGAVPHVAHKTSSNGRAVLRAALGATWRAHRGQFAVMAIALTVVTAAILSQPLLSGRFLESLVSAAAGGPNGSFFSVPSPPSTGTFGAPDRRVLGRNIRDPGNCAKLCPDPNPHKPM